MLTSPELERIFEIHTQAGLLESCLTLTQCDKELTVIIGSDIVRDFHGIQLIGNHIVRLVPKKWYHVEVDRLILKNDDNTFGWCDADSDKWVPNHSKRPFEVVPIAESEHQRLISHLNSDEQFEFFKYVQLVYLGCDGFSGAKDLLKSPGDYARLRLPGLAYL